MAAPVGKFLQQTSAILSRLKHKVPTSCRWIAQSVTYQEALALTETKVTSLKNQLRVASETSNASIATVGVWAEAGRRHETEKNNGIAHFLEHMMFKDTSTWSQLDLENEVENLGMRMHADAGREHFAVFATCLQSDVPKAMEIIADTIYNSTFSDSDIDIEKTNILRELEDVESDLKKVTMDYLFSAAYQGTPLAHSKYGTTENIKKFTSHDLAQFVKIHFKPPHMVVAGAGGVEHSELVSLADKYFGNISLTHEHEIPEFKRCRFTGSEIRARYDDLPLAHLAIAVEGAPFASHDSLSLLVASSVIGSWDRTFGAGKNLAGKLAALFAEEKTVNCFGSFYKRYSDTALWGLHYVCDRLVVEDVLHNVQAEWMRLCSSVTEFEVQRAKNQLKMQLLLQRNSTTSSFKHIGRHVLYTGSGFDPEEVESALEAVTAKTVREACMKYIYDKCPAVVGYGPLECMPDYNRVRGAMYWLRL